MHSKRLAGSLPSLFLISLCYQHIGSSVVDAAAFLPSGPIGTSHVNAIPSYLPQTDRFPVAPLYLKKGGKKKKKATSNLITVNKLAFRNYEGGQPH
mmetsp:Transcript_18041/g.32650  ORF Transcript_18041/g.32650 Transcript_18041/m.32650 type:complete len:96 (+) Transcript_18041:157-444(+)